MKPSDLINASLLHVLQNIVHETFISGVGIIEKVIDDNTVLVNLSYAKDGSYKTFDCAYLTTTGSFCSTKIKPAEGDNVLVLALQYLDRDKKILTEKEPLAVQALSGYTIMSSVCFPIGVYNEEARTRLEIGDDIVFITEGSVSGNVSGDISLTADGDGTIKMNTLNINDGDKGCARLDDEVEVTIPPGTFLVGATGAVPNPDPVTVKGKITKSSGSVVIGD